jgi:hypothetical protein
MHRVHLASDIRKQACSALCRISVPNISRTTLKLNCQIKPVGFDPL